jgi:6-phosphogluconolactonase
MLAEAKKKSDAGVFPDKIKRQQDEPNRWRSPMVCWLVARLLLVALILGMLPAVAPVAAQEAKADKFWVFIGTYTGKQSKGIYRCELDVAAGKLSEAVLAIETADPSFLAIHPTRRLLYAVGEGKTGTINAFALDAKSGSLKFLNSEPSGGAHPCHLVVDRDGKNVLAANYTGGSVCVLPLGPDGTLAEASCVIQHKGKGTNPKRQSAPHAHSINLDAANRFAFVADLGLDKVLIYRFDPAKGTLTANEPPAADVAPGAGPRHFAFHPNGKYAYVINELDNTVSSFDYDAKRGILKTRQTVSTLPRDFKGTSHTAEVVVHPSGKWLYGSNRGHDSIVTLPIDPNSGEVGGPLSFQLGVKTPRNFAVDPTGQYLLAGGQASNRIHIFRIGRDGSLGTPSRGAHIDAPTPVCIRFVPKS